MDRKITGTMVYYYFVCKRKLWYFSNEITMEQYDENVSMGKLLDETSYKREDKHINIDSTINIDFMKSGNVIHEVKKSKSIEEAGIWQVKYYLYYLLNRGSKIKSAVIDYPLIRQRNKIELCDEDINIIENVIKEITTIITTEEIPKIESNGICKKCAYYFLCYV